ncbi:MAG: hypothetical protein EB060_06025 [Proteobacteria bacterium]|nr:hypothetical protein [Pseudomonadota bacterium]
MAATIYGLCALTAFFCAWLLLKAYQSSRYSLLMWSGLCFAGLTISNALLVVDKIFFPTEIDLSPWRYAVTLVSMIVLLYGLIWETE